MIEKRAIACAAAILTAASCTQRGADGADGPPAGLLDGEVDAVTPGLVETDRGPVLGHSDGTITAFLGIPYASPPIGALRWRPPEPHAAWTEPFDAAALGAACAQPEGGLGQTGPYSEDCLTLNVWSPDPVTTAHAPVMVFIHGGAFKQGSSNQDTYNGRRLATAGVVVVTLNYRLGVFGFLAHPALSAEDAHGSSGNVGLLDQQAALRWVHDNVAVFGGDPGNVTVFGESAGAMSVCAQLTSPLAAGLFRRAISESGPCSFLTRPLRTPAGSTAASAESAGVAVVVAAGCDGAPDVLSCMRAKTADELIAAAEGSTDGLTLEPNIDGYVLPEPPALAVAAGHYNAVDGFVGGVNQDEATLFTTQTTVTTQAEYEAAVTKIIPAHATEALALYNPADYPSFKAAYDALVTDLLFACPTRAQTQSLARNGTRSYEYLFTRLTAFGRISGLGVYHGSELPFVFGNLSARSGMSAADRAFSDQLVGYWTRFATSGDPGGSTTWPLRTATVDAYLELATPIRAATGLHASKCDVIETWRTTP